MQSKIGRVLRQRRAIPTQSVVQYASLSDLTSGFEKSPGVAHSLWPPSVIIVCEGVFKAYSEKSLKTKRFYGQ